MNRSPTLPTITVLAGTDGAGRSSIAGALLAEAGEEFFNPDEAAKQILRANPDLTQDEASSVAWREGKCLLEESIAARWSFRFETTLGGTTIPALIREAAESGLRIRIWFEGLASADLHIQRVRERVAAGGHDIPEWKIRERYDSSRRNLIRLLPFVSELRVFDNTRAGDPKQGIAPEPLLILATRDQEVQAICPINQVPDWAKPILAQALNLFRW